MNKLIGTTLGIAISIIVVASILVPTLNEATTTEETFTNEGYARYTSAAASSTDEITITWDYTEPTIFTIGEQDIDCSAMTAYTSVVLGDDWSIRFVTNGSNYGSIQYLGPSSSDYLGVSTAGTANCTITLNAGTMTITDGTSTKTADYTNVYYPDNSGIMTMKKSSSNAYLLSDSSIVVANGATALSTSGTVGIAFSGTIEAGYDFTLYRDSNDCTIDNVESNYSVIDDYVNLVELSTITFDITTSGGDVTTATYSYFLVPYEVTANLAHPLGSAEIALLDVIPILMIISIVMLAIGIVVTRRD